MRLGSATQGGAFYPMGQAISTLVNRGVEGVNMVPIVTEGSIQNPRLVNIGENDIGITNNNLAVLANQGAGAYADAAPMQLRAIGPLHSSVLHMMTLDGSSIETIADLRGKRVAVGPAGGGTVPLLAAFLSIEGMTLSDIVPSFLSYGDGFSQLSDGNVDAAFALSGFPAAAVMQASVSRDLKFLNIPDEQADRVRETFPSFSLIEIPAETYDTPENGLVIADTNVLIVDAGMDETLAYQITRAIYGDMAAFRAEVALAGKIDLSRASSLGIPLHPGAQRFFTELDALP